VLPVPTSPLLRAIRTSRLSQAELAARAGVSKATITRILREGRPRTLRAAAALAAVLGLELEDCA
jgi:transcriptional regulator with XRE-family HTH domain